MLKKELAAELGISAAMVTKLAQRGMPTDSLTAAQEWRRRNLDPGKVKPGTSPSRSPASRPSPTTMDATEAVASAQWCMDTAAARLAEGGGIGVMVPALRRSLSAVPESHRHLVGWSMPVAVELTRHAYDVLDMTMPIDQEQASMTASEAEEMGAFWYQVAAGELLSDGWQG